MTLRTPRSAVEAAVDILVGDAKRTGRSVRSVARWAHNTRCETNNFLFATLVDDNKLLGGTRYEVEYGQSPSAIARGKRVEAIGRTNTYAETFALLREHFGFEVSEVVPLDLRRGFEANRSGLVRRARATQQAMRRILCGVPDAPNVIDGAVLAATMGGYAAYLEADGVGAKAGPLLFIIEFKGWPVVDGQADDAGKMGETVRQMGVYRWLLQDLVERHGQNPDVVAAQGLIVTPKNVGLTLVGTPRDLTRETRSAQVTLTHLPDPAQYVERFDPAFGLGQIADSNLPEAYRVERADRLIDVFGHHYQESCLSSCGLAKLCRDRVHDQCDPIIAGQSIKRFLPGIATLRRAADLADGSPASSTEIATGAAAMLAAAGSLYRAKAIRPAVNPGDAEVAA